MTPTSKTDPDFPNYTTFYGTVIQSKEWYEWEKVAHTFGYDWHESTETGWLSPGHFQAFLEFVRRHD